jgi:hypothetical protein
MRQDESSDEHAGEREGLDNALTITAPVACGFIEHSRPAEIPCGPAIWHRISH